MVKRRVILAVVMGIVIAACGGSPQPGAQGRESVQPVGPSADRGRTVFAGTCASCHGPDAEGVPGLGKDLSRSEFIAGSSDQELLELIESGRAADDPDNTTGVAMPPSGGNPSLTEEDILDVIAYLRTLTG